MMARVMLPHRVRRSMGAALRSVALITAPLILVAGCGGSAKTERANLELRTRLSELEREQNATRETQGEREQSSAALRVIELELLRQRSEDESTVIANANAPDQAKSESELSGDDERARWRKRLELAQAVETLRRALNADSGLGGARPSGPAGGGGGPQGAPPSSLREGKSAATAPRSPHPGVLVMADIAAEQEREELANKKVLELAVLNGVRLNGLADIANVAKLLTPTGRFNALGSIKDDQLYRKNEGSLYARNFGVRSLNGIPVNRLVKPPANLPFREVVAIGTKDGDYYGSGTLIARNLVLTAGHLIEDHLKAGGRIPAKVFVGVDANAADPEHVIPVKRWMRADGYSPPTGRNRPAEPQCVNDLAVLLLAREVTLDEADPAEIATSSQFTNAKDVYLAGFGTTGEPDPKKPGEYLSGVKNVGHVALSTCDCDGNVGNKTYSEIYSCIKGKEFVALDLWHRDLDKVVDTTPGDSGGPAYIQANDGHIFLAGVTSRSVYVSEAQAQIAKEIADKGRAAPLDNGSGFGGIYVRVDKYLPFIEKARKELTASAPSGAK
jgi:hypothetical protein